MDFPVGPFENARLAILEETGLLNGVPNPALEMICADARAHFGVQMALVTLLGEDVQCLRARSGIDASSTSREVAFCNYTILEDRVFIVRDAREDDRFRLNALVTGEPFIRFYAGAPLVYMKNIRLGAFCLIDSSPGDMTLGECEELRQFADLAVAELVRMIHKVA